MLFLIDTKKFNNVVVENVLKVDWELFRVESVGWEFTQSGFRIHLEYGQVGTCLKKVWIF